MRHPSRSRTLTDADRAEWAAYARHLRLLPERQILPDPLAPAALPPGAAEPPATGSPAAGSPAAGLATGLAAKTDPPRGKNPPALAVGVTPGGLDGASWKRLRSGKLTPERKLDLHGHTAQRAHATLLAFLHAAHAEQLRCVEIVTGRGTGETGGVLRRELPHWLNGPGLRPLVLAAVHPHPQNPGAVRLLLRRSR